MGDFDIRTGDDMVLTPSQKEGVEYLRKHIILHDGSPIRPEQYEYKRFEVSQLNRGIVFVYSVVGMKGDEGTMAEVLCRRVRHITIGKRGGLHLINADSRDYVYGRAVLYTPTR